MTLERPRWCSRAGCPETPHPGHSFCAEHEVQERDREKRRKEALCQAQQPKGASKQGKYSAR